MNRKGKRIRIELIVHLLIWLVLFYIPLALSSGTDISLGEIAERFWLQLAIFAVIFYTNYLSLIGQFLFAPKKKTVYILINLMLFSLMLYLKFQIFSCLPHDNKGHHKGPPLRLIWYMDFMLFLIPLAFAIAIYTGKRLISMQVYQTEAENIRLQAELQHLKFQLQPHFFFNSLNNTYSHIDTDPEKAKQSIHSMSKLMRHLLQASDASTINLSEEIDFLKKYIALMELRLNPLTSISADFPEQIPEIRIAPLLFISLVENAFKHGVSASHHARIYFNMEVEDQSLSFISRNTIQSKPDDDLSGSGIGLANLRKRLELLYPKQYELSTHIQNNEFVALLRLKINGYA